MDVPKGLAFDSAGNLYVGNVDHIEKFTAGGIGSVFASSGLSDTEGLRFDGAGNLYAVSYGTRSIEVFTPAGVGSVFASGLLSPRDIAFASVPEPSTFVLAGLGLVGMGFVARRKQNRVA